MLSLPYKLGVVDDIGIHLMGWISFPIQKQMTETIEHECTDGVIWLPDPSLTQELLLGVLQLRISVCFHVQRQKGLCWRGIDAV